MTVKLTGNFLATARCLIFQDSGSGTWTFDPTTNELTISAAGGSTGSGNPTATIGLTAVDGSATTWMTSDSAPALSQAIVPTWTGAHTFSPASGTTTFNGVASTYAVVIAASTTTNDSKGLLLKAGTSSSDFTFYIENAAGSTVYGAMYGDGGMVLGAPTGGDKGAGTLNVAGNLYVNGSAVGASSGANPTGTVGLSAVNGSATTFLRSDGAPALSVAITPTWTGAHTFTPSTAVTALTVNSNASAIYGFVFNGADNQWSGLIQGNTTTGQSYGLLMQAGTNASDYCFDFTNAAGNTNILRGYGEGSIVAGAATGANKGAGTINVSGGYYVNGTAILAGSSGTFTGTLTGCTTSPTGTCAYAIAGNVCTLFVASITGTSNTTAMTITGLPSAAQPTRTQLLMPPLDACENGGAVVGTISMSVAASGTITFLLGNSTTGFGNTLVKGVATGFTVSYLLN